MKLVNEMAYYYKKKAPIPTGNDRRLTTIITPIILMHPFYLCWRSHLLDKFAFLLVKFPLSLSNPAGEFFQHGICIYLQQVSQLQFAWWYACSSLYSVCRRNLMVISLGVSSVDLLPFTIHFLFQDFCTLFSL